jgi:DNA-binding MarR family transcriptional regulator
VSLLNGEWDVSRAQRANLRKPHNARLRSVSDPLDLKGHLPTLIAAVAAGIALHANREYAKFLQVSIAEWRIIALLGRYAPVSYNDVASQIRMDRAGISRTIALLERRGFIERVPDRKDRRQSIIVLTAKGTKMHDRIAPLARKRARRLEAALTATEFTALRRILGKLQKEIDTMVAEIE